MNVLIKENPSYVVWEDLNQEDFVSFIDFLPGIFCKTTTPENTFSRLNTWKAFIELALDALTNFKQRNLKFFDALVGETRCDIRAFYFLDFINGVKSREFDEILEEAIGKFESLKESDSSLQLGAFDFQIHKSILYIIFCYILTISAEKKLSGSRQTDLKKLKTRYPGLSSKMSKKLAHRARKYVSYESVLFLQKKSEKIKDELKSYAKYLQDPYITKNESNKNCGPAFFVGRIILERLLNNSKNIIALKINFLRNSKFIKQEKLLFKLNHNSGKFDLLPWELTKDLPLETPVYTIEGCCVLEDDLNISEEKVIKTIKQSSLISIILSNYAHKPFYPKSQHQELRIDEKDIVDEINYLKSLPGYSIQDPHIFCVTHISLLSFKELSQSIDLNQIFLFATNS